MMKQFKYLFLAFFGIAFILFSCQKEVEIMQDTDSIIQQRVYADEEDIGPHNPKVKDYEFLVSTLGPIFDEYDAKSLFKDLLYSTVIESVSGDHTYYCFAIEEYKNVTYKVLTKFDSQNEMVELGIVRIGYDDRFLADFYDNRMGLQDFKGVISSYDFDDFMSASRTVLEDCLKLVFGDDSSSGGGIIVNSNDTGNDESNPTGDDTSTGGTIFVSITCGCAPAHAGGNANASCRCTKPNEMVITVIENIKGKSTASTRNDYWDCIDILLGSGLISDEEILAKRLKDCDLANEPYDTGEGENDEYPDTEFCEGWLAYRDACLSNNTETNDVWGHYMLHYNGLFNTVISDPSDCVSTEEMEEIICVKNAIDAFETDNGLELTKAERKAIEAGASCGEGFEDEAWAHYLYTKGLVDEAMRDSIAVNGVYDTEGRIIIKPIDWSTATDNERVNHIYKNLRYVYYMLVCERKIIPEYNLSHSYSINEFFTNFTGTGDFWVANENISIKTLDGTLISVSSFSITIQSMTTGSDLINVLGSGVAAPVGNGSDLYSFYWPRGGTNNSNTSVIDIRGVQNIIDSMEEDFYIPCN